MEPGLINKSFYTKNIAKEIFTYISALDLQGLLLNAAQNASSQIESTIAHAKLDKINYIYPTRSYGVGAFVGLTDNNFALPVLTYGYIEIGYRVTPLCIYDPTP